MAQSEKYRSNGSAAYDMQAFQQNTAQPLERPERLPEVPVRRKPVRKVRTKLAVAPFTVLGSAAAVLLLVLVVFSYVRLYEAQSEVGTLQSQLSELTVEQARLQSQFENSLDLKQIEARAKELGMRQPGSSQIIYVQVDAGDTAEVYTAPAERNIFQRIFDAFKSVFTDAVEYFS